eukprot:gene2526-3231_t
MEENEEQNVISNLVSTIGIDMIPLSYHTSTVYKDNMYCYGGRSKGTHFSKSVYKLNLKNFEWSEIEINGPIPPSRCDHTAVLNKNEKEIIIFGGWTEKDQKSNEVYTFNLENFTFTKVFYSVKSIIRELGKTRGLSAHSACFFEDDESMIVYGGYDGNIPYSKQTLVYHTKGNFFVTLDTLGDEPPARIRHSAIILHKKMYIFGGFLQNSERSDSLFYLNLSTKIWSKIESTGIIPSPRSSHICLPTLDGKNFLIFNGKHHSNKNEVFEYDVTNNNWSKKQIIGKFEKKNNLTACWYQDTIYIFGGRYYEQRYNSVESLKFGKALKNAMNLHLINLLSSEVLSDTCFIVDGKKFKCHKCILSQSAFFKNLLLKKTEIHLNDIKQETFSLILDYLYGAVLPTDLDSFVLMDMYSASIKFEVHTLAPKLTEIIKKFICKENVLDFMRISNQMKCETIKNICLDLFGNFKDEIIKQPGMKLLDQELFLELLSYKQDDTTFIEEDLDVSIEKQPIIIFQNHLSYLFESKEFFDVLLCSEQNIPIKAHKAILYLSSQYFQGLFRGNSYKDSEEKQITFQVSHKILFAAIQFMYNCTCDLPKKIHEILELIKFADFLILNGLKEIALGQLLFEITPENAFEVLELAIDANIGNLVHDMCWKSIYESNKTLLLENLIRIKSEASFDSIATQKQFRKIAEEFTDFEKVLESKVDESILSMGQIIDKKIENTLKEIKSDQENNLIRNREHFEKQLKDQKLTFQTELLQQKNQFQSEISELKIQSQKSLKNQQLMYETILLQQKNQMQEFLDSLKNDEEETSTPKKRKLNRNFQK